MNIPAKTQYGGATYYAGFCESVRVSPETMTSHLLALPWETKRTARHELFMSDEKLSYTYGGKAECPDCNGTGSGPGPFREVCKRCNGARTTKPLYCAKPFTTPLFDLMREVNGFLGTDFNAIFLNKYDDQHQHLGWHSDSFEGMRKDQPIAVISYGAEREIWLKNKRGFECQHCEGTECGNCRNGWRPDPPGGKQPLLQRVKLEQGSLFVMPIGYQDTHLHRIPKHDRPCGWRISLTLRSFHV